MFWILSIEIIFCPVLVSVKTLSKPESTFNSFIIFLVFFLSHFYFRSLDIYKIIT